jgi:hypothetical protein
VEIRKVDEVIGKVDMGIEYISQGNALAAG